MSLKIKSNVSLQLAYDAALQISSLLTETNEKMYSVMWFLNEHKLDTIYDYNDLGPDIDHVTIVNNGYRTEQIHRINVTQQVDQQQEVSYNTTQIADYFPIFALIEKRRGGRAVNGVSIGVTTTRFETSEDLRTKVINYIVDFAGISGDALKLAQSMIR